MLSDDMIIEVRRVVKRQSTMLTRRLFVGPTMLAVDVRREVAAGT